MRHRFLLQATDSCLSYQAPEIRFIRNDRDDDAFQRSGSQDGTPADAQALRDLLIDEGYPAAQVSTDSGAQLSGEGHDLHQHGARVVSLAASSLHFHAASDRWPGNVNAAGAASIARAVDCWTVLRSAS